MSTDQLDVFLLIGAAVLVVAILAVRASVHTGLPSLLAYLALGLVLGNAVLGIDFSNAEVAHSLGFAGLMLILAEGGVSTRWANFRASMVPGLVLATLGVAISVLVVASGAHFLLGMDWRLAVLLAAVTSPTDAAAVFSVLRAVPLKPRVSGVLEAESGLNDAPIVVLVTAISAGDLAAHGPWVFTGIIVYELIVGAVIGIVIGYVGAFLLRRVALSASGLYPLAVLAFAILGYGIAASANSSGFAAVYLAALVLGNTELPHRTATRSFIEGVGWLSQIGLFVMLGLLANPDSLRWEHIFLGLAAGAILTFIARPLSVAICLAGQRPIGEQIFLAWSGLRGAVPIVMATIPLAADIDGSGDLFDVVFVFVVVYTVLQAPTLGWLARRTGVLSEEPQDVEVEVAPLERTSADLIQIRVPEGSKLAGVEVSELRLPHGASVSLIVRDNLPSVPHRTTRLRTGDDLLIVAPRSVREAVERRLRAVGKYGRLAGWHE